MAREPLGEPGDREFQRPSLRGCAGNSHSPPGSLGIAHATKARVDAGATRFAAASAFASVPTKTCCLSFSTAFRITLAASAGSVRALRANSCTCALDT